MTADSPERGEIWLVRFDRSVGDEIRKERPAVVLSSTRLIRLKLRIVVPLTGWSPAFDQFPWHYKVEANKQTGLSKTSSADALQIKSVSVMRFVRKLGSISESDLKEITQALVMLIEG
jgi:mRNA interferase MazF